MSEFGLSKSTHNIFNICIDSYKKFSGRNFKVYNCYFLKPCVFFDINQLFGVMNRLFDAIDFPQTSTKLRTFNDKKNIEHERKELDCLMTPKEVSEQRGAKGTFVVHVLYRQNATWQGNVVWAEKNITKSFRSAMELMNLIDSALNEAEEEQ